MQAELGKGAAPRGGPEQGSALYRALLARQLNALCGCTTFTAWNVDDLPSDEVLELTWAAQWERELREFYGG